MPRTAKTGAAGARAAITLALSCLLAVAFGFSSLSPTTGAPVPTGLSAQVGAESHSDCPVGTQHASFERPDGGWPDDFTEFSNGAFSVWTYLYANDTSEPNAPNELWFWNAWPPVVAVFVTGTHFPRDQSEPTTETRQYDYDPPAEEDYGLTGHTSFEHAIVEIEFCYGEPPPPSECPTGTSLFAIEEPAQGWSITPYYAEYPDFTWEYFGNRQFSVALALKETEGLEFYFDAASRGIYKVFLWRGARAYEYPDPDYGDFAPGAVSTLEEYLYFPPSSLRLVEICYESPPPPPGPSSCPLDTSYAAISEPDGGWFNGTYSAASFSVDLDFFAPAVAANEVLAYFVDFAAASRPVRKVFVADESNLPVEPWPDTGLYPLPGVTGAESLHGPDFKWITRIEFCYVPLPLPTPTLPLPTPTLPLPTLPPPTLPPVLPTLPPPTLPPVLPTLPPPTPTPQQPQTPTQPPTASPAPSPSPFASPTPALTAAPVITAAPTEALTPTPSPAPTPAPTVAPTEAPAPTESPIAPTPRWYGTVAPIGQVTTDLEAIAFSALLVLLFMLMALFPASLMNETLESNYDTISGWFARGGRRLGSFRNLLAGFWRTRAGIAVFMLLTALIYGFLDPAFGLDAESIVLFLGIVAGIIAITILFELPIVVVQRRNNLERGVMRVLPLTIVIALICVLISRVAEFQPGYLYGLIAFWAFDRELSKRAAGFAVTLTCMVILAIAVVAWALMPVAQEAFAASPLLATFVATVLAVIFIGGLEGLLIELVPLRFMRGRDVWLWRRSVWLVLFAIAGFFFVHVLLHPGVDYLFEVRGQSVGVAVSLFVIFGVASVLFWGYFRYLHKPQLA